MDRGRVVSGDYRGFVMIWDMEDIVREKRQFEIKQTKKVARPKFVPQDVLSVAAAAECECWHLPDGGPSAGEDGGRGVRGHATQLPPGAQGQRDRPLPRRGLRPGVSLQRQNC